MAAKSGVTKSLEGGKVYAGMPARDIRKHNKSMASINLVEKLYKKVDILVQNAKTDFDI